MSAGWSIWPDEQLAYIQQQLNLKLPYLEIRQNFEKQFQKTLSKGALVGLIHRGTLTAPPDKRGTRPCSQEVARRRALVLKLLNQGASTGVISSQVGVRVEQVRKIIRGMGRRPNVTQFGFKRPKKTLAELKAPRRTYAPIPKQDIFAAIGVTFWDLQANHCRFPVARDPIDKQHRFCGERRCMNGHVFTSSYCQQHHLICTREEIVLEAAE